MQLPMPSGIRVEPVAGCGLDVFTSNTVLTIDHGLPISIGTTIDLSVD